ncbi:coiled-coil domain-containing protein 148-like isoform X2 [Dreissena polymorpha]|uniref:coiled-coil domain-containing protein 148-like isoform X2 n=1 Tax=Dreissena polymorpha TaxID=45954 RepID=UPI0022642FBA|nr:coiled-coil domain-containing protein 148-like isoform X2 [Dreissena polymorpha]
MKKLVVAVNIIPQGKMASQQRPFVLTYKSDEIDKLAHRAIDGVRSNKIKPVDYEKLRNLAAEKKFSAHKTLLKVKKFEHLSKQNKENHLLKQHKLVWQKEFIRLNCMRKRIQSDIENHIRDNSETGICSQMYQEFEDYQTGLENDFAQFKKATTEPVWNLREDLQFWMQENMADLRLGAPDAVQKHAEIRCMVDSVKSQQGQVLERLKHEQTCLEQELKMGEMGEFGSVNMYKRPHIDQGIPEEAFDLECPDEDLKANVLKEFIYIDEKYLERLNALEEDHEWTLSHGQYGGWDEMDHFHFVCIYDQYTHDLANRRTLIIDRIKRQVPGKTRPDIVEHEHWWDTYKFFNQRSRAIMSDWARDRHELMEKSRSVFMEACVAHELEEVKLEYTKRQEALRDALYDQVLKWREQKMEAMDLQATIMENQRAEIQRRQAEELERESHRRKEERKKVKEFQDERSQKQKEEEEAHKQRLAAIQRALAEQAVYDRERIKYREEQIQRKIEERKHLEEEKDLEEQEKEYRLEMLREKVRVVAESNPERMMSDTVAWQARQKEEEAVNIQKPLFNITGFTATQVTSDNRVRLEQKLREAGLHTSSYARQILSQVPPPQPPRRDMESKVFKFD